jgi:hypothetical protein
VKNLRSDATVYLGMMVLCLGFLDTIGRYSYQYIGWWSYLTGIPSTILNILKHIVIIILMLIH